MRPTLGILAGVVLLVALGLPLAQASLHDPYQDLGATVEAGEYLAYRVEMPTSGWVFVGGEYNDAASEHAVLPIVNILERVGGGYSATTGFYYDTFQDEWGAVDLTVHNETAGHHNVHSHGKEIGSSPLPGLYFGLPSGTYDIVSLTGPADGTADVFVEVPADATVLAQESDQGIWGHGLKDSSLGYMLRAQTSYSSAQSDYHEWYYSGAEVEIDVQGTLFGYMGFASLTEAHWESPAGEESDRWVVAEGPGTWTMSFPEEHHQWRNCVANTVCLGETNTPYRVYPPFGVAADVDLG